MYFHRSVSKFHTFAFTKEKELEQKWQRLKYLTDIVLIKSAATRYFKVVLVEFLAAKKACNAEKNCVRVKNNEVRGGSSFCSERVVSLLGKQSLLLHFLGSVLCYKKIQ